jgi:hypothetical protein
MNQSEPPVTVVTTPQRMAQQEIDGMVGQISDLLHNYEPLTALCHKIVSRTLGDQFHQELIESDTDPDSNIYWTLYHGVQSDLIIKSIASWYHPARSAK